jgi:hypothetical protein
MLTHGTVLFAVQAQLAVVCTVIVGPVPPLLPSVVVVGDRLNVHEPPWETVTVCPPIVSEALR